MSFQSIAPRDTVMLAVLLAGLAAGPAAAQSPVPAPGQATVPPTAGGDGQATRDLLNQAQTAAERRAVEDLIERLRTGGTSAAPAIVAPGGGPATAPAKTIQPTGPMGAGAPTLPAAVPPASTVAVPAASAPAGLPVLPPAAGRAAGVPPTGPSVAAPPSTAVSAPGTAPVVMAPAQPGGPTTNVPVTSVPVTTGPLPAPTAPGAAVVGGPVVVTPGAETEPAAAVPAAVTTAPGRGAAAGRRGGRGQPAVTPAPVPVEAAAVVVQPGVDPMAQAPELADKLNLPRADFEIYFDFNSADITPKALAQLSLIGQALADPRLVSARFLIGGHTDAKGSPDINLTMSRRRAEAVRKFLIDNYAVDPARLAARGYGKQRLKFPRQPLAEENRRVQIINWTGQPVAGVFR